MIPVDADHAARSDRRSSPASDPAIRNRSLDGFCRAADAAALLEAAARAGPLPPRQREPLRAGAGDLLPGGHLPLSPAAEAAGRAPGRGALTRATCTCSSRRFEEAVDEFLAVQERDGPSDAVASALAAAYHALGFQTLADQVRRSVRSVRGNQWMFRMGHPADHPLRIRRQLLQRDGARRARSRSSAERTPVRMDLSHSGWSDIFFLGMDFPEGARVLNVSVDLGVRGRDRPAAAADRGLSAGHRPAGAAAGERRSEVQGRRRPRWPRSSISPRTTWGC